MTPRDISYVFLPLPEEYYLGPRPNAIIVAFERDAWHRRGRRVVGERCRAVFVGEDTLLLNEKEFLQALEIDRSQRRDAGWPVYEWNPATNEVTTVD